MSEIRKVKARQVLDSRGNPTVEAEIEIDEGTVTAMVPSGASTGVHEALELLDGGEEFHGKGVSKAVENANTVIASKLKGMDCTGQREIDEYMIELDGTGNKEKLGANAILAVSMAACKAGALSMNQPLYQYIADLSGHKGVYLPTPQLNVINGGEHAGMENDIQENMYMPTGAKSFREAIQMGSETYHTLKSMIKEKFGPLSIQLGDEGGFVPPIESPRKRLDLLIEAAEESGYSNELSLALDPASSEFYYPEEEVYRIGQKKYTSGEMVQFWSDLVDAYPIVSIEDGMAEDDWRGWSMLKEELGDKIQLTGDDLLVTNVKRIKKAIEYDAANALLLKVNQIGSVTESIDAAQLSYKQGWGVTVSHRSGETEDSFIADLAVGLDTGQIKAGAPARSERLAKYNQLLRIEEELDSKAKYAGKEFQGPH